jgi:hypothetical protein
MFDNCFSHVAGWFLVVSLLAIAMVMLYYITQHYATPSIRKSLRMHYFYHASMSHLLYNYVICFCFWVTYILLLLTRCYFTFGSSTTASATQGACLYLHVRYLRKFDTLNYTKSELQLPKLSRFLALQIST